MSKVTDLLREYTAPLEDNYGKEAYEEVLSSLEQLLPAAFAEDAKPVVVFKTREEIAAFAKEWDRKVDEGRGR